MPIQPLPVDAGSFYAGNRRRGILFTAAELALLVPVAVVLEQKGWWRGMHGYSAYAAAGSRTEWTTAERNQIAGWLVGYIVVKAIGAIDAAHSAERHNRDLVLR